MKLRMKRQQKWFLMAAKAINKPTTSKALHDWCHDNIPNYHRWRCTPNQTGNILSKMPEFKVLKNYTGDRNAAHFSPRDGQWHIGHSLTVWMLTRGYFDWYKQEEE